jgi:hypothetical protein
MRSITRSLAVLASIACLALQSAQASAEWEPYGPYPKYRPFQTFPDCTAPDVLGQIVERARYGERFAYRHGEDLRRIDTIDEYHIEAFGPAPIQRRFCKAKALMSTGHTRKLYYMIEKGMGLAGTGYKVEFCLQGLDHWGVYDGNCRVLRY